MAEFKPSKTQQRIIDQIAKNGYILEDNLRKTTRDVLYIAGIIYYDTVREERLTDHYRGWYSLVSCDAFLLTDKGKTYVTVKSEETAK